MRTLTIYLAISLPLFAQDDIPDSHNLLHDRHLTTHNQKHPRLPISEDRFFTNRDGAPLELTNEAPMFTFAVFGDRTGGPPEGVNILADAVRDVNLFEPDLVMTVGDLINGYNTTPEWMPQMKEFKGIMSNLLCPWYPVAGNHDVYWRGPNRPPQEHEDHYERHFGPLWYAFEHKDCFFIVLYSDEANPQTGERNFGNPDCQRMSPAQFSWLQEILAKAKDAQHVFLFLHHPRWIGGNYGDDWEKVHAELVKAGNVSAVFAGHIHYMRYDPRDGIQYIALGTTGGHNVCAIPSAGFLHHYDLVTVRKDQIAVTAYPVGAALDVRDITPTLLDELKGLLSAPLSIEPALNLSESGSLDQEFQITLKNTSSRPVEYALTFPCPDNRWTVLPDHKHLVISAGESATSTFRIAHMPNSLDTAFAVPSLSIAAECLTKTSRYPLPTRDVPLPFQFTQEPVASANFALDLNGNDQCLALDSSKIPIESALTLEAWCNARYYAPRTGLATKTQESDYGLFVNNGRPKFSIFIGDSYLTAQAPQPLLKTGQWHHIAGVYDGEEARLYVDGKLVDSAKRAGVRRTNDLPLLIGADTSPQGAMSHFNGLLDTVRLSTVARYTGETFEPARTFQGDENTLFLSHMDLIFDTLAYDQSGRGNHADLQGNPTIVRQD